MIAATQCWAFQDEAVQYLSDHPYALIHLTMGAGKSLITIRAIRMFGAKRTVIICPQAVLGIWRGQFMKHAPEEFDVLVLDVSGGSDRKAKLIFDAVVRQRAFWKPLVVVVNYETMWRPAVFDILMVTTWDVMVCDEIHRIKSPKMSAKASKACWNLGKRAKRRIGLTGTPAPHSPMDFFSQYRFLDDTIFGRYVTHYRNHYAIMNRFIPAKVDKWVNQEELHRKVDSIRFHIDREILVLPDRQDITIECPLSPKGMAVYKAMKKDCIAEIRQKMEGVSGEERPDKIRTFLAGNGAVKFLRLLQLAQGYSKDDEGNEVDTDTEKRKMLLELLEEAREPVCVYGWFKHDMGIIADSCQILGLRYGEISGSRKDLTSHGLMPEDIDVEGVQCKSGSSGIDLTRSRIAIILNTGTMSPGDYDQMLARQHRPGQTRNVVYYHLVTPNTVDATAQVAREQKRDVVEAILNGLFEDEAEGVF